jgi:hypothetical protein
MAGVQANMMLFVHAGAVFRRTRPQVVKIKEGSRSGPTDRRRHTDRQRVVHGLKEHARRRSVRRVHRKSLHDVSALTSRPGRTLGTRPPALSCEGSSQWRHGSPPTVPLDAILLCPTPLVPGFGTPSHLAHIPPAAIAGRLRIDRICAPLRTPGASHRRDPPTKRDMSSADNLSPCDRCTSVARPPGRTLLLADERGRYARDASKKSVWRRPSPVRCQTPTSASGMLAAAAV